MKLPSRKFSLDRGPVKKCFDQYFVNDLKVSFVLLQKKKKKKPKFKTGTNFVNSRIINILPKISVLKYLGIQFKLL